MVHMDIYGATEFHVALCLSSFATLESFHVNDPLHCHNLGLDC